MNDKFKDATPTSTLVIKPLNKTIEHNGINEESLKVLTKNEIVLLAQQELGIELDHRLSKQEMITKVVNDNR